MTHASPWLRRIEIALWILGVALLGAYAGSTVARWNYQAQQERALFKRGPATVAGAESGVRQLGASAAAANSATTSRPESVDRASLARRNATPAVERASASNR